ncbi:MAG: type II secretion system protein [Terrimicrobiaceae bacterium]|nr:type II secretion system protein [Terrimicrobiaceae bacterium]
MEAGPHHPTRRRPCPSAPRAFTLVELLLVIAIIAIMASLVISAFSNAAADSREVLVRQQQAVVQEAINSWLSHKSAAPSSLSSAKSAYAVPTTGKARLDLVAGYLDDTTYAHLVANTSNDNQVRSDAMIKTGQYLEISAWDDSHPYPKVNLVTP